MLHARPLNCRRAVVRAPAILAAAFVLGATGCGDGNGAGANGIVTGETAVQPIVVTRDKGKFRPTCGPREVGQRLRDYANALETVDADALRSYWGRGFMRFGIELRGGGFVAEDYEAGVVALEERGGVRLRFREVEVVGAEQDGGAGLDGTVWREVEGRSPGRRIAGKVQLSCSRPTIIRLSATDNARNAASCPDPGRRVRPRPMVVCSGLS